MPDRLPATTPARDARLRAADHTYLRDMERAMAGERTGAVWLLLALLTALFACALAWAWHGRVEEITRGEGRIIASSREQVIQSLEGGILAEMLVREGDTVQAGQPLLRIDGTKARSTFQEAGSKMLALQASAARLRAEARDVPLRFPAGVQADAELVRTETDAYRTRRQALEQAVQTARSSRALIAREIAMTAPMVERGLVAETELLRLRRQFNDLEAQLQDRSNRYRADAAAELAKVEADLAQLQQGQAAREDQVRRTVVTAPVRGIVKNIRSNTRGGVIQPAQDIMEIIPLEDRLLVEAKIRPHDVAFIRPGLPATVKITAYDHAIYGSLPGHVELLSPDTLRDERRSDDDTFYRVLVRTSDAGLSAGGQALPIIPGMTATVEIRTGEKTILDYLLKPILKAREAFRER